ncbi:MAG TPA: 16S rRNA (cytidine(1402)-2'-O)-methyltransferase [Verrucomicrobia bacterium]|nr:16S rRNA (cytidine(1402)-2'-O)-methyltransferase [Verrucomicrobiota bacterium]
MLSFVTTPIGNLEDMSPRAVRTLAEADVIACEDTRRTRALLTHFDIPCPRELTCYRDPMEVSGAERLLERLKQGLNVAVCSDGGAPGISDPGYRIARLCAEHKLPMEIIPGPSAVTAALVLSGLPTSSFTFKGFPPRKRSAMLRFFEAERGMPHTLVLFESPYRVGKTLAVAKEALGDREAAVCMELTKKFERVSRGYLSALISEFGDRKVKGEVTMVIAGDHAKFARDDEADDGDDAEDMDAHEWHDESVETD